ncbi:alpha/beta fold hydrolase [Actinoplanes sp. NPDC051346]|uniref:alpha/beta fold hydrolase n=1 Tax=Actinoplanes sp. NPDC051346 TaxID=3155048 RepID=UPI003431D077
MPGFADNARSWQPLIEELADETVAVTVADLPGFGASPAHPPLSIEGCGDLVADLVLRESAEPVTLIGHSLGSVIAVEAAYRLGRRCSGVVSIEGNLTPEDAYFSGRAADHQDAVEFKNVFSARVRGLVADGHAPSSYAEAVDASDAESMWVLGRDARARGASGEFGDRYRHLPVRNLYLWASSTTPPETRNYLLEHSIPQYRLPVEHHWPWSVGADIVAKAIRSF